MTGQGRPQFGALLAPRRLWSGASAVIACAAILLLAASSAAADLDLRLRLAWGGGESSVWQGTIQLSSGTLSEVVPLGLEADDPGSMQVTGAAGVRIFPRSPRSYDGCDLLVQAPADAKLIVLLAPAGSEGATPLEVPLSQVLKGVAQFPLDERHNRMLVQRSPGDALRVTFDREHLVFGPSEKLELQVEANPADVAAGNAYLLSASLLAARTDDQLWNVDLELKTDAAGQTTPPVSLAVPLPPEEGVYDVRLALYPKRLTTTLVRGKPILTRKVQVVVVAPVKTINPQPAPWQSVLEIDPANPKWWERMARLPSSLRLPNLPPQPVGSGATKTRKHLERTWVELPPAGWQAYPLTVAMPGQPHILEIEYPSDLEQTLSISIVEPNAAGQVGPIGLDSGIDVPTPAPGHKPAIARHRLIVWPSTRSPLVLMVNRRDDRPAVFGKFNVFAGPAELTPLEIAPSRAATRTLAAYFDKPHLAANFSATKSVDSADRCLSDWLTFLQAGQRLVETLRHSGQNAAMITVACEGGAIYPSELLQPTPQFDSGQFFEGGHDPVRKDVLELLFRLCDRSGIQLIPAVQFASPLPKLEAIRLAGGADAVGLEPLGPDGRTWLERNGARRGMGVYYNALDERVQAAMIEVVAELAERYGQHASFGGVGVQIGAESFAALPDETCSYDPATLDAFAKAAGIELPDADPRSLKARAEFLHTGGEEAWLKWRTERTTALFAQMREAVVKHRKTARLYLATGDLLAGRQVQLALRPALPPRSDPEFVLRLMGLDFPQLAAAGIVAPRPQRILPAPLPLGDFYQHYNQASELDAIFLQSGRAAALHFLEPAPLRLPEFDAVSPFGPAKTHTWLVSQIPPAGSTYRERFARSLARLDSPLMFDGGWMLPLGQEAELAPLARVFRRLPQEAFTTVKPTASGEHDCEVVVRMLQQGGKTIFYAVNAAPWPVELAIEFSSPEAVRVSPYAPDRPAAIDQQGPHGAWTCSLQPFDLVGGEIETQRVTLTGYRTTPPDAAAGELRGQIRAVRLRANSLRSPVASDLLENASFESPAKPGAIPGWVHARGPGIEVGVMRGAGLRSPSGLHVVSRPAAGSPAPIVWVRSAPLPVPTTGRLSLFAWVRAANADRQPILRLAIEGKVDGRVKYWKANVGASEDGQPVKPLSVEWSAFRFPVVDLPQAGLTDLRIGFDLMGEGDVWIDEVQVFDLWFEENERDELLKSIATADLHAGGGRVAESQAFLGSYWPSFLRRHIQLPEAPPTTASSGSQPLPASETARAPPANPPAPSMTDRLKTWLPKSWR